MRVGHAGTSYMQRTQVASPAPSDVVPDLLFVWQFPSCDHPSFPSSLQHELPLIFWMLVF